MHDYASELARATTQEAEATDRRGQEKKGAGYRYRCPFKDRLKDAGCFGCRLHIGKECTGPTVREEIRHHERS